MIQTMIHERRGEIVFLCILNAIVGILCIVPMYFMQKSIDSIVGNDKPRFIQFVLLYIFAYVFAFLMKIFVNKKFKNLEIELINETKKQFIHRIMGAKVNLLENMGPNSLCQKLLEDFGILEGNASELILNFTFSLSSALVGIYILFCYDYLILLILFPLSLIATLIINHSFEKSDEYSLAAQESRSSLNQMLRYGIIGARDIILYMKEKLFFQRFEALSEELMSSEKKSIKAQNISQISMNLSFNLLIGLLILFGGLRVGSGYLSIGALIAVIMYSHMITDPIFDIVDRQRELLTMKNSIKRINSLYAHLDEREPKNLTELKDVDLSYKDNIVLKDFNLKIQKGDVLRIFGKTGSGKSSIAKLITGIYLPVTGDLLINGEKDKTIAISSVFQSNTLFDASIEENIKFWQDLDDDTFNKIVEITHVGEIIEKYKDAKIGDEANKLSGGERTRILIARALAKESDLYIFDEISTGLDVHLFNEIIAQIMECLAGKTMIFIDHQEMDERYFTKTISLDRKAQSDSLN
ncbi:MAG: ABC transporter ATP-binding protein [Eubacteriales bacterium]|nr:ABC transporter ATP-binding protein [Eubacteriales bacterium]